MSPVVTDQVQSFSGWAALSDIIIYNPDMATKIYRKKTRLRPLNGGLLHPSFFRQIPPILEIFFSLAIHWYKRLTMISNQITSRKPSSKSLRCRVEVASLMFLRILVGGVTNGNLADTISLILRGSLVCDASRIAPFRDAYTDADWHRKGFCG